MTATPPGILNGVVPVTGPEHLLEILRHLTLVPDAYIADNIALEMRRAALQWRFGEDLGNHVLQAFQTVGAYQPKPLDASLVYVIEHLAPAVSTLRGLVVDDYHLPRLVRLHGQQDIERFRIDAALAVNLDMHAVNEQDWIVFFQTAVQPLLDILFQVLLVKDSSNLLIWIPHHGI